MKYATLKRGIVVSLGIFCMAPNCLARWVTAEEVEIAAASTLASELFQKTFPEARINSVVELDGLWCVNLSPKGYLMFSGSTKRMPLLHYSTGDYLPPIEGSPAAQIQREMRVRTHGAEVADAVSIFSVAVSDSSEMEARWENLLNPSPIRLFSTSYSKQVGPLMTVAWNQWAPWNDFCPQATEETGSYQGRTPAGCVATMYAQIMKYFAWPVVVHDTYAENLSVLNCVLSESYSMRFHGGKVIDWSVLADNYDNWEYDYTKKAWEPKYTEKERLPIARLTLLVDILSKMSFSPSGSSASLVDPCNNKWYATGDTWTKDSGTAFTEESLDKIKRTLDDGLPLPSSIPNHAVVIDGYAEEADVTYLNVNYGWGGTYTQFYEADELGFGWWILNHAPKMNAQLLPFPRVIKNGDIVKWCVPNIHKEKFTGFTVAVNTYSKNALTTWSDPATSLQDVDADPKTFIITGGMWVTDPTTGVSSKIPTLRTYPLRGKMERLYHYPQTFILSKESQLSFIGGDACYIDGHTLEVQIKEVGASVWETVAVVPNTPDWCAVQVSLAKYADAICQLRLRYVNTVGRYYLVGWYSLAKLQISNVYDAESAIKTWNLDGEARQQQLTGLQDGERYCISLTPYVNDEPVASEKTIVAISEEPEKAPDIESVANISGAALIDDTLLKGDLDGRSGLRVTCNDAVTSVKAFSSCPTLIPDDAITIYRYNEHVFDVVIDSPQTASALDGSRMMITLEAENAQGDKARRDLVFALRSATESVAYTAPVLAWEVEDEGALEIPCYWFRKYGLITADTSLVALQTIAKEDKDGDGLLNWQEFLCGTSPLSAEEKLQITGLEFNDNGTLKSVKYSPALSEVGNLVLEGKTTLEGEWKSADLQTHKFFRVRATVK